jgi:hypothetical protein
MHTNMKAHTYNTYTYIRYGLIYVYVCVCICKCIHTHIATHTYQIHTCKILHVSACMACMCMYMPVSACMNLLVNMHVASSNKWIVPKFLSGSLKSSRLRRPRMCESWTIYTTGSEVPISQWCQSLCHANLPVNPSGCALSWYWQSHVQHWQADSEGPGTGHVGHILQPFQRRIGTAQMLSVTVPAIGCTGRKLEVGHWHPIQLEFRVNRLAVQVCFGGYGEWHAVLPPTWTWTSKLNGSLSPPSDPESGTPGRGWSDSESASPSTAPGHGVSVTLSCHLWRGVSACNSQTQTHTSAYIHIHTHMNIPYLAIFYSSLCSYIHIHAHTVHIHWHADISQIHIQGLALSSIQYYPCHCTFH